MVFIIDDSETFIPALQFFTDMLYKILGLMPYLGKHLAPNISSLFVLHHLRTSGAGNQSHVRLPVCPLALHFHVMMVRGVCTKSRSISESLFYPSWLASS